MTHLSILRLPGVLGGEGLSSPQPHQQTSKEQDNEEERYPRHG